MKECWSTFCYHPLVTTSSSLSLLRTWLWKVPLRFTFIIYKMEMNFIKTQILCSCYIYFRQVVFIFSLHFFCLQFILSLWFLIVQKIITSGSIMSPFRRPWLSNPTKQVSVNAVFARNSCKAIGLKTNADLKKKLMYQWQRLIWNKFDFSIIFSPLIFFFLKIVVKYAEHKIHHLKSVRCGIKYIHISH